jgi:hypothetical protein
MDHGLNKKTMTKKYILKPGKHQFVPGSYPVHDNNNLSDEEAGWYLEKYPHIAALFIESPKVKEQKSGEVMPGEQCYEGTAYQSIIQ